MIAISPTWLGIIVFVIALISFEMGYVFGWLTRAKKQRMEEAKIESLADIDQARALEREMWRGLGWPT